jgi:quercetin dioxygenase-like cupin family protein
VGVQVTSRVYPLRLPLEPDERQGWKPYPVFSGTLGGRTSITCHVSVLMPGCSPHAPHSHAEEELLLVLSGEVDLLFSRREPINLPAGEFVYYPAHFSHTLQTKSTEPATYVMFKWRGEQAADRGGTLPFGRFDTAGPPGLLFQAPTRHLGNLHSHVTVLEPGDGYPPHTDAYDVAIVVLTGEVETIGARAEPCDVIYYLAGEAHGMRSVGDVAARYVVFEFHGRG